MFSQNIKVRINYKLVMSKVVFQYAFNLILTIL